MIKGNDVLNAFIWSQSNYQTNNDSQANTNDSFVNKPDSIALKEIGSPEDCEKEGYTYQD